MILPLKLPIKVKARDGLSRLLESVGASSSGSVSTTAGSPFAQILASHPQHQSSEINALILLQRLSTNDRCDNIIRSEDTEILKICDHRRRGALRVDLQGRARCKKMLVRIWSSDLFNFLGLGFEIEAPIHGGKEIASVVAGDEG